ncbi:MAG: AAA family ATPase [Anaerolineae bacterium]
MLIERLKVSGLLSFSPQGIDLPLGNLNVLIGPNGSGKSNFLEVLALLKAAPTNLSMPVKAMGGIREWLWKNGSAGQEATVEVLVNAPDDPRPLQNSLTIAEHGGRFEVVDERIQRILDLDDRTNLRAEDLEQKGVFYAFSRGRPVIFDVEGGVLVDTDNRLRRLRREDLKPEESILSQRRDPERYPALAWLQDKYEQIHLYRNWAFGPGAALRREQSTHGRADFLADGGENLPLVLSHFTSDVKSELLLSLRMLYDGIEDYRMAIMGGAVLLYVREQGGREVPATRLSDGTLRFLGLLTILLHPAPPPLIAIEEPELGLHPDVIPHIARLLMRASQRTQLVVTTHSRMLVDALSGDPSSVIVCEKADGASQFERLDPDDLALWLEKYSLGDLWSMGELGGNRW